MNTFLTVVTVILVILLILLAVLYFFGRKLERRQRESESMLKAAEQTVSMLIIDKKKLKMKRNLCSLLNVVMLLSLALRSTSNFFKCYIYNFIK